MWEVEFSDEFERWWNGLEEASQGKVPNVPIADRLFERHVETLAKEDKDHG